MPQTPLATGAIGGIGAVVVRTLAPRGDQAVAHCASSPTRFARRGPACG